MKTTNLAFEENLGRDYADETSYNSWEEIGKDIHDFLESCEVYEVRMVRQPSLCPCNCLVAAYSVKYVHVAAFRNFSGEKTLCPGCLFAQADTTEFVAMFPGI